MCCLKHTGSLRSRQASLREAEFCFWIHRGKRKDSKRVSLLIVLFLFFLFILHFSWTWWDKGRTVTQWSEQMDPNLHGRSSWLCDCFSALCFIWYLPIVLYCLSDCRSLSLYLITVFLTHINTHTYTHNMLMGLNVAQTSFYLSDRSDNIKTLAPYSSRVLMALKRAHIM